MDKEKLENEIAKTKEQLARLQQELENEIAKTKEQLARLQQELEKEIAKTKEQLARLQQALDNKRYERWKPQYTEKYWYVTAQGGVNCYNFTKACVDCELYDTHNCFKTREQAEQEAEKILVRRMLEDIARRLNKGKKIDWKDINSEKYFLYYDNYDDSLWTDYAGRAQSQGVVYCLDENFKDIAIEEIGEERLIKYLKGE